MRLSKEEALQLLSKIKIGFPGSATAKRIELIEDLNLISEQGDINYEALLTEVFEGAEKKQKIDSLSGFRKDLAAKAKILHKHLILCLDNLKKADPKTRILWFEGVSEMKELIIDRQSREVAAQPDSPIESYIQPEKPARKKINYFISYAHDDEKLVTDLVAHLQPFLDTNKDYQFIAWLDSKNLTDGKKWKLQIQEALKNCDFGLMLLSVNALNSQFIIEEELSHFLQYDDEGTLVIQKSLFPVGLKQIPFDSTDMKGLEETQIFRQNKDGVFKFYAELSGSNSKDKFCIDLIAALTKKLNQEQFHNKEYARLDYEDPLEAPLVSLKDRLTSHFNPIFDQFQGPIEKNRAYRKVRMLEEDPSDDAEIERIPALKILAEWESNDDKHLFALLGQFGMGKTFTCVQYMKALLAKYKSSNNRDHYTPFYFDLRDLDIRVLDTNFRIDDIIGSILTKKTNIGEKHPFLWEEFHKVWTKEPTLIIMDGIDEILPHLKERQLESRFLSEIWKLVPDFRSNVPKTDNHIDRKMVLTCRTDYFKNLVEQQAFFTGEQRKHINDKTDYEIAILCPFTKEQVLSYLDQQFPDRDPQEVYQLLADIHNLEELSQRPVLISFIAEIIDELEQKLLDKARINTATLYETLIDRAFTRDSGKHEIPIRIKKILLEQLSVLLWQKNTKRMSFDDLEAALCEILTNGDAQMKVILQQSQLENLYKDLRNATLLVRASSTDFGFSHTSIQEYFLAKHLIRQGMKGNISAMAVQNLSIETIDFLWDILQNTDQDERALFTQSWHLLLSKPPATNNYWPFELHLKNTQADNSILERPPILDLTGIDFQQRQLQGRKDHWLDLRQAIFHRANANLSEMKWVDLTGSQWQDADLGSTEFEEVALDHANLTNAIATGHWRKTSLLSADFKHFDKQYLKLLLCNLPKNDNQPQPPTLIRHFDESQKINLTPRHFGVVSHVQFAPDGKSFISASRDNTIKLWDINTNQCIHTFNGHQYSVTACQFAPDGKSFISASVDRTIKLWNINTKQCIHTFNGHQSYVTACQFAPDGKSFISASNDKTIKQWDINTKQCIHTFNGHKSYVTACQFALDGKSFISASYDKTIKHWDINTNQCINTFNGHKEWVTACQFAPDGKSFISASFDNTIKHWDINTNQCINTFNGHKSYVTACQFAPDGKSFISASFDNTIKLWDINTKQCIHTFNGHQSYVTACQFAPDGKSFISASFDNTIKLWDINTKQCINTFNGHKNTVTACQFAPDGKSFISASSDHTIKLWDINTKQCIHTFYGHQSAVTACQFAPDGKSFISASFDNTIKLWDINTKQCIHTFNGHKNTVTACQFAPDGKSFISASYDHTIKHWDINTKQCIHTFNGHQEWVTACQFAPDGKSFISASWDNTIKQWNINTKQCIHTFNGHKSAVTACQFAPDGKSFISASYDHTIKQWDINTKQCIHTFYGHQSAVTACQFAPDGKSFISASEDKTIKLWDINTKQCIHTFNGHKHLVTACHFAPDGKSFISASRDGTSRHWHVDGEELLAYHHLGKSEHAIIENGKLLEHTPGAWRDLQWESLDDKGHLEYHYFDEVDHGLVPVEI